MRTLSVAALVWFALAAPAGAQTDADLMAPIQKFIDSFNKGDTVAAAATHAAGADLTITDEVPPYTVARREGLPALEHRSGQRCQEERQSLSRWSR